MRANLISSPVTGTAAARAKQVNPVPAGSTQPSNRLASGVKAESSKSSRPHKNAALAVRLRRGFAKNSGLLERVFTAPNS